MIDLILEYWHWWGYITSSTWVSFFVGFYIKNKYGSDEPSELGRALEFIFERALDMPCNWFLTFFPFFGLPASLTELVTHRLERYKKELKNSNSMFRKYQYYLAVFLCFVLSKADKNHC